MAEAGLRIEDGHSVIGPGLAGSRDRSATMIAVVAVEEAADRQVKQAADMQPTSLKANFMLEDFGGFSFQQGGASYSTIEFLPFDGDHYKEVAHIRGVNLLSAAHTSARLEYINNNIIVPSVQAALTNMLAGQAELLSKFQREAEDSGITAEKRKAAIDKVTYLNAQAETIHDLAVRVPEFFSCIRTDLFIWDVTDALECHSGIVPNEPDQASRSRRSRIARKFMLQSGMATIITRQGSTSAIQRKIIDSAAAALRAGGLVESKNVLRGRFSRDDIHATRVSRSGGGRNKGL